MEKCFALSCDRRWVFSRYKVLPALKHSGQVCFTVAIILSLWSVLGTAIIVWFAHRGHLMMSVNAETTK
jgi:hypothetical protein